MAEKMMEQQEDEPHKVKPSRHNTHLARDKYVKRKRGPHKPAKKKNMVLVHRKSNFKAQMEKCRRLLDSGEEQIIIHGLGAAINRAINLALQLELEANGRIKLSPNTASVDLYDDYEPILDELEPQTQSRTVSSIHIRVIQTLPATEPTKVLVKH